MFDIGTDDVITDCCPLQWVAKRLKCERGPQPVASHAYTCRGFLFRFSGTQRAADSNTSVEGSGVVIVTLAGGEAPEATP